MDKVTKIHAEKPDSTVRAALADYKAGVLTSEEIATKHGVCTATLTVWATKAGMKLRTRGRRRLSEPTPRHRKILELAGHLKYEQIGERFGMHKQQVHRIVKRWKGWKQKSAAPFQPGDVIAWKGKRLTVVDAGLTEGTLKDDEGTVYRHFTWAGPTPLKKIGVNPRHLTPAA